MINIEHKLINCIKRGDQSALKQWLDLYRPWLDLHLDRIYSFIYYRVGKNPSDAEDLLQEVMLAAWEGLNQFEGTASFYTWCCGIAKNKISAFLKTKQRLSPLEVVMENIQGNLNNLLNEIEQRPISPEEVNNQEVKNIVNAVLSSLPPHYQTTLIDKYFHNIPVQTIAQKMNISFKALESVLARAREAFKQAFLLVSKERSEING